MMILGILTLLRFDIKWWCMAPLTHAVMIIGGFTFHPLCFSVCISGSHLQHLISVAVSGCQSQHTMGKVCKISIS